MSNVIEFQNYRQEDTEDYEIDCTLDLESDFDDIDEDFILDLYDEIEDFDEESDLNFPMTPLEPKPYRDGISVEVDHIDDVFYESSITSNVYLTENGSVLPVRIRKTTRHFIFELFFDVANRSNSNSFKRRLDITLLENIAKNTPIFNWVKYELYGSKTQLVCGFNIEIRDNEDFFIDWVLPDVRYCLFLLEQKLSGEKSTLDDKVWDSNQPWPFSLKVNSSLQGIN